MTRLKALTQRIVRSDFTQNGALLFGATLFANAFNYLYYMLMGRTLSVGDYGAVMSLISVVLVVLSLGTIAQTVVAKLASDMHSARDPEQAAAFAHGVTRRSLWIGGAIALSGIALQGLFARYLHLDDPRLVAVAALAAGLGMVLLVQRGLFQGYGAFAAFSISSILDGSKAFIVIPLSHAFGALGSVGSLCAAFAAGTLFGEFALRNRFGGSPGVARLDFPRLIKTGGITGLSTLGIVILMFYDVVLARHFLDPISAGLYGAAALSGRVLFAVLGFLPTVLLPSVAQRAASGRSDLRVLGAALGVAIALIGSMVLVGAFVPELIIRVLAGPHFIAASPLVFLYVLASGALALANVLSIYAIARHQFGFVPYLLFAGACEIALVAARHPTSLAIVQDILVGHVAVFSVMGVCVFAEWLRSQHGSDQEGRLDSVQ